jgi:dGTPase
MQPGNEFLHQASRGIFEVQLVAFADEIAQVIHDFEDAIFSSTIDLESVLKDREEWPLIDSCLEQIEQKAQTHSNGSSELQGWIKLSELDVQDDRLRLMLLARLRSEVIYQLTSDMFSCADEVIPKWENEHLGDITTASVSDLTRKFNDFVSATSDPLPKITYLNKCSQKFEELRTKLFSAVVNSERVNRMDGKADYIIRRILEVYLSNPKQAPQRILNWCAAETDTDGAYLRQMSEEELQQFVVKNNRKYIRAMVDHVATMSDRYVLKEYDQLYAAYPRSEM